MLLACASLPSSTPPHPEESPPWRAGHASRTVHPAGARRAHVLQQPYVGGERDDGTEHAQVGHRQQAAGVGQGGRALAHRQADQHQHHAAADHLPGRGHERARQVQAARPHRTERPADRCDRQQHQPGWRCGQAAAGIAPDPAQEADGATQPLAAAGMLAAQRREQRHPQRHRGHRRGRQARGHLALGQHHHAIAQHQHGHAHDDQVAPLPQGRLGQLPEQAQRQVHHPAGNDEAAAGDHRQRQRAAVQGLGDAQGAGGRRILGRFEYGPGPRTMARCHPSMHPALVCYPVLTVDAVPRGLPGRAAPRPGAVFPAHGRAASRIPTQMSTTSQPAVPANDRAALRRSISNTLKGSAGNLVECSSRRTTRTPPCTCGRSSPPRS
ncbi:hypothetical protein G6F68_010559 [Rhizopus microsporus]|nr:hypothetical protein G6F68_010559 [Rhizopus microsporus]